MLSKAGRVATRRVLAVRMLHSNRVLARSPVSHLVMIQRRETSVAASGDTHNAKKSASQQKKKDDSNIFLDNLGTIFLTTIGLIIAYLVRSFWGTSKRNALRNALEQQATLDPLEIDELRRVNPVLTAAVFRSLLQEVWRRNPDGQMTYAEFTETIRELLVTQHKNIPTIEFGHLLDRVVLRILEQKAVPSDTPLPITLWMVVLSLALNSPTPDRIRVLHDILQAEPRVMGDGVSSSSAVTVEKVRRLVEYMQATDQLVIDTQLIPTVDKAYPIQQYHQGSPDELVQWEGEATDAIDVDALASILRSRSVCAWGECYSRKKFT